MTLDMTQNKHLHIRVDDQFIAEIKYILKRYAYPPTTSQLVRSLVHDYYEFLVEKDSKKEIERG